MLCFGLTLVYFSTAYPSEMLFEEDPKHEMKCPMEL